MPSAGLLVSSDLAAGTATVTVNAGGLTIVTFIDAVRPPAAGSELAGMKQLCNFIQANGTGFGICKSCRLGALGGAKR